MKSNILPAITSLLLVFLSSPMVRSQDTYPDVSMKVDLVAWGDGISGLSIGASANKAHTVSALPFSYSKAVTYSGPSMLEISQSNVTEVEAFKGDIPDDVSVPIAPEESAKKAEKARRAALAVGDAQEKA